MMRDRTALRSGRRVNKKKEFNYLIGLPFRPVVSLFKKKPVGQE